MENITVKEVNQLLASDGEAYNYFGASVAFSADGLVAMVGAYTLNANETGKVYTYNRDNINDDWKEVNIMTASDDVEAVHFGSSVSLSSDGLVAIVGDCGDNDIANGAGKVYTYIRDSIKYKWVKINQLTASDGGKCDYFGSSVSLSSDGLVAIVGATSDDDIDVNSGKVYTYIRATIYDRWNEVNKLSINSKKRDNFGCSVSLSGDGLTTMIGSNITCKVYTYTRNSITDEWVEVNHLTDSNGYACDFFGTSVSLSSDGLVAIVGADSSNTEDFEGGKIVIYSRDNITDDWVEVDQLFASDSKDFINFGSSVALSSDGLVVMVAAMGYSTLDNKKVGKVYTYTINNNSE